MPPADPSADSPYAPPRAGRGGGLWRAWFAFRRRSRIGEIRQSPAVSALQAVAASFSVTSSTLGAAFVPSLGFYLLPNPRWRRIGLPIFWGALFFALTEYGRPAGSAAFGLAAGAHAIAAVACSDLRVTSFFPYPVHILRRLFVALVAALLLTMIASRVIAPHLIAIAGKDGPVLISPSSTPAPARAGELVAYRLQQRSYGGYRVREGIYWGRVLAAAPDRTIVFDGDRYLVDDAPHPALPRMPFKNQVLLAPDEAFIWPVVFNFAQGSAGTLPADIGRVPQSALVGRPYKRWFWHKQTP